MRKTLWIACLVLLASGALEARLELTQDAGIRPQDESATNRLAGMTQDQIRAQFGPPSLVQDSVWYYDSWEGTLRIYFKNDIVTNAQPGDFDLSVLVPPGTGALPVFTPRDPGVTLPSLIKEVKPEYPSDARRAGIEGSIFLACTVQPNGVCSDIRVVRSLEKSLGLDREAVKALRQWRFKPGTLEDKPVPVRVTIEMSFALKK